MRRIPLGLAVATALVPVLGTLSATPAQAAGSSLTVTTIGRNGAKITSDLNLVNTRTGKYVSAKSGRRVSLAKGLWSVTVDIETPNTSPYLMSDTLVGVRYSVTGNNKLTLDARRGKLVRSSVDALSGAAGKQYRSLQTAAVCSGDDSSGLAGAYNVPGQIYEVPNPGSTYFHFAWLDSWVSDELVNGKTTQTAYYVTRATTGMPTTPSASYRRSGLAKVALWVRSGETPTPTGEINVGPTDRSTLCEDMVYGSAFVRTTGPYNATAYVTPGDWSLNGYNSDGDNVYTNGRTFKAGHSYGQAFGAAVYGPTSGLPVVANRSLTYNPEQTIGDDHTQTNVDTHNKITLSLGGKVLKSQTITTKYGSGGTFSVHLAKAGWYVLTDSSTRVHAAPLSSTVTLDWHFHADPKHSQVSPGYLTTFNPAGLNSSNSAPERSTTSVAISVLRSTAEWQGEPFAAEHIKSLKVYASHDGGKTWHALSVRKSGSQWVAKVPEPGSKGLVALRTVVVDTAGASSTESVYRAFNVG
ncbi:hypothetical protein ACEZCY_05605 [Streptacidiphilus sp. N1-12]|uniref:Uncharacterized protein n=2 Tax=Streptacidiphilus alkalitolerans TaxID=3342712 RepID=A0ABV6V566_9ACTN